MSEPQNTATPAGQLDPKVLSKIKIPRKFEIFVEEYDEEKGWKPVMNANIPGVPNSNPVLTVTGPDDLQEKIQMYRQMEQRFKIVREIDPPTVEQIMEMAKAQGIDIETGEAVAGQDAQPAVQTDQAPAAPSTPAAPPAVRRPSVKIPSAPAVKPKPKIVTVGDIQIKYDGDKVYQKQWIKLTAAESSNFRVVNDANNKITPLTGKHIEALKWVLVEETDENEDDSAEKLLNA